MYVRTIKGKIFDCFESEQMGKPIFYPKKSKTNGYIDYTEVYKKSNNIIDICEVGDYVNGYKVLDVMENMNTGEIHLEMPMDYTNKELGDCTIYNKDIKSIVTREAMKSVEYTIE